jgi:DNA-directed RNA polymerase subunit RPC12/RpoP
MISRHFAAMARPIEYYICLICKGQFIFEEMIGNKCPKCGHEFKNGEYIHSKDYIRR